MVELLRGRARPVVRVGGDEEAHVDAALRRRSMRRIIPRSVTYGLTTSRVSVAPSSSRAIASVIGRNGPGALWRTIAGTASSPGSVAGKRASRSCDAPPEPEEARDEHELELADDRPFEPHEQVVEPPVLEVVLDPCAADPADAAVDDDDLAVVDVPDGAEVPAVAAPVPSGPCGARVCVARTTQISAPAAASRS